jgi:hypothetical protein
MKMGLRFLIQQLYTISTLQPHRVTDTVYIKSQLSPDENSVFQSWVDIGVGGLPYTVKAYGMLQILNKKFHDPLETILIEGHTDKQIRHFKSLPA